MGMDIGGAIGKLSKGLEGFKGIIDQAKGLFDSLKSLFGGGDKGGAAGGASGPAGGDQAGAMAANSGACSFAPDELMKKAKAVQNMIGSMRA